MLKPILLVEDNPIDLDLVLRALEKAGLANEVVVTRDGDDALDFLYCRGSYAQRNKGNPTVVLLDLKLPRCTGLEVLQQVRKDPQLCAVPVVILTASDNDADLVQCYALGANAYVVKPIGLNDFVTAVQNLALFWAVLNEPPPGSQRSGIGRHPNGL